MHYVIYCRKSSESEERQVLSIESQLNELLGLAEKEGFEIGKIFKESMSAKAPGRPVFGEMMDYIETEKDCCLLCWKLDRLARNALDGGKVSWFMDRGLIREVVTPESTFRNISNDQFMMSLNFGMAKKYVDDLSVNVKRGNRAKLEKGWWPGPAPLGYLNDRADKTIYVDQDRAPFIARAFELYATGGYSVKEVTQKIYDEGFRTRVGNRATKSMVHRMLSNPFYCGIMERDGKCYPGAYEPIVSQELFEKASSVMSGKHRAKKQKHFFAFRGYMECAVCGCMITATKKKGHDYYYCTNGKGLCEEHRSYMRSEYLAEKIASIFGTLQFDEELIELGYLAKKEMMEKEGSRTISAKERLQKRLRGVEDRQMRVQHGYEAGITPEGVYGARMKELEKEKASLKLQIAKSGQEKERGFATLEQTKKAFLGCNIAEKAFLEGDSYKKRQMLEKLLWNLSIKDKKIADFSLKEPYQTISKIPKNCNFSEWLGGRDSNLRVSE